MAKTIITILFLFPLTVSAQILNTERFRLDEDSSNLWLGTAELGIQGKKQKTDVFSLNSKGNLAYLSDKNSYMFLGYLNLVKVAGTNVLSEGYGHARFNFMRKKLFSVEQFNQLQFDQGRGMIFRILSGANVRFRAKSSDKWELGLNTGVMQESEKWQDDTLTIGMLHNIKSTTSASLRYKVSESFSYIMISYYQARFDTFFKPRITFDASMQLSINKYFSIRGQFVGTFDAAPVIDIASFIYSINNTLVFKF